jgi:hypothetical protein
MIKIINSPKVVREKYVRHVMLLFQEVEYIFHGPIWPLL